MHDQVCLACGAPFSGRRRKFCDRSCGARDRVNRFRQRQSNVEPPLVEITSFYQIDPLDDIDPEVRECWEEDRLRFASELNSQRRRLTKTPWRIREKAQRAPIETMLYAASGGFSLQPSARVEK